MPDRREPTGSHSGNEHPVKPIPLRLVFIGRIDPFKGVHLLLDAIAEMCPEELELDIYGQAVDEAYYRKCIERSRNWTHVKWKGVVGQQQLIPLLSTYDALCLPSTFSEMSPLVIQEAFAAGIPVIGSDVYGIAEQVKDGINGLLFPFNNVEALRRQIRRLIDQPEILDQLTVNTQEPPSFTRVAGQTMKVYKELTGRSSPAAGYSE